MSISQELIEERKIGENVFHFLVIDKPEKWEQATDVTNTFPLTIPNANKRIEIPMKGISYSQWATVMAKFPVPEHDGEGEPPAILIAAKDVARKERKLALFEIATGMTVPGKDFTERSRFIDQCNPGDIDSMEIFITRDLCNTENFIGPYLAVYSEMAARFPQENVVKIESFADLMKESIDSTHAFKMNRLNQTYIVEFPLRVLSAEQKQEIEKQTAEPTPPMVPQIHPVTGQPIPGKRRINRADASWIRNINRVDQKRTLLYLNACLPFKIPGDNEESQMKWIGDRLVGDVKQVNNYITDVILGLEGRYSFFTTG